jgi:hypothetical protein
VYRPGRIDRFAPEAIRRWTDFQIELHERMLTVA